MAGLASSLFGSAKAKKKAREQRRILDGLNKDNETMFNRDYYQDAFDDPSSRSYLKRISKDVYDKNSAIENSAVSTGATHENILANKQSANEIMSDAVNNVVVNQEAKKAVAKERYLGRKSAIASGQMDLKGQEAQNAMTTTGNITSSVGNLAGSYLTNGAGLFNTKGALPSPIAAKSIHQPLSNKSPYMGLASMPYGGIYGRGTIQQPLQQDYSLKGGRL